MGLARAKELYAHSLAFHSICGRFSWPRAHCVRVHACGHIEAAWKKSHFAHYQREHEVLAREFDSPRDAARSTGAVGGELGTAYYRACEVTTSAAARCSPPNLCAAWQKCSAPVRRALCLRRPPPRRLCATAPAMPSSRLTEHQGRASPDFATKRLSDESAREIRPARGFRSFVHHCTEAAARRRGAETDSAAGGWC